MKKIIRFVCLLLVVVFLFAACNADTEKDISAADDAVQLAEGAWGNLTCYEYIDARRETLERERGIEQILRTYRERARNKDADFFAFNQKTQQQLFTTYQGIERALHIEMQRCLGAQLRPQ
ncbi:hypothetical protein COV82_00475 [Candidatus Peregrinibacteria bacterium CG11_big_fil_rev_8_21_14_0_20_46_8]|nr:MAG: hypothetical protein COV82_00475 [Candidatus Peregrinibacteria bacterium CG11_big_fil_rev_8_21_14_0_20_46_8]